MVIRFTAYGVAQPKGSAKAFVPKGWKRAVVTSDNAKNKGWQQVVAEAASRAIHGGDWQMPSGPVHLVATFYLPRPQSLPKRVQHHLKKPDLDKLVRSVKDALTKVVWHDDSQVVSIEAAKQYADAHETPRVTVEVINLAPVNAESVGA